MPATSTVSTCAFSIRLRPPPVPRSRPSTLVRPATGSRISASSPAELSHPDTKPAISRSPGAPGTNVGLIELICTSRASVSIGWALSMSMSSDLTKDRRKAGLIIAPMAFTDSDRDRPYLGIHAVDVFVRDQEQSLRFYVDQLGFNLAFDARLQTGDRWLAVSPKDGTAVLALVAPAAESREY